MVFLPHRYPSSFIGLLFSDDDDDDEGGGVMTPAGVYQGA